MKDVYVFVILLCPRGERLATYDDRIGHLRQNFCLEEVMHIDRIIKVKDHLPPGEFEIQNHDAEEIFVPNSPLEKNGVALLDRKKRPYDRHDKQEFLRPGSDR